MEKKRESTIVYSEIMEKKSGNYYNVIGFTTSP